MLTDQLIDFHRTLLPAPPHFGGTGALALHPDRRDYDYRILPGVCDVLAAGIPDSFSLAQYVTGAIYNQGSEPSCVAFSTCGLSSLDDVEDGGAWQIFDGHGLYREAGGNGSNGVDTRVVLDIATKQGLPLLSGGRKECIGTYAFLPQVTGQFRQAAKAAIAAGHACTLAVLLPTEFGYTSSGGMSTGYHQMAMVSYDPDWVTVLNSWGPSFGQNGLGRLPWDYIEQQGMQNGYAYGYATTPVVVQPNPTPNPIPTPTPVPQRDLSGKIAGPDISSLQVSQPLTVGRDTLTISSLGPLPQPLPTPNPTPDPTPTPNPAPVPRTLTVSIISRRFSNNSVAIWSYAMDANGYVDGTATGTIGSIPLQAEACHKTGVPAVWEVPNVPVGPAIKIQVVTADGRSGSATA